MVYSTHYFQEIVLEIVIRLQCRRLWFNSWVRKIHWRRDRVPTPVFLGFPCGSACKNSTCNAGDLGSIPRLGRSPGEGKGYPLWYSGLENSMDYVVHGVTKSRTWLQDFHFHFFKYIFKYIFQIFRYFYIYTTSTSHPAISSNCLPKCVLPFTFPLLYKRALPIV